MPAARLIYKRKSSPPGSRDRSYRLNLEEPWDLTILWGAQVGRVLPLLPAYLLPPPQCSFSPCLEDNPSRPLHRMVEARRPVRRRKRLHERRKQDLALASSGGSVSGAEAAPHTLLSARTAEH